MTGCGRNGRVEKTDSTLTESEWYRAEWHALRLLYCGAVSLNDLKLNEIK